MNEKTIPLWPHAVVDQASRLQEQGLSLRQIAAEISTDAYTYTRVAVRQKFKRLGISGDFRPPLEPDALRAAWPLHSTTYEVAKSLGYASKTVLRLASALGLPRKARKPRFKQQRYATSRGPKNDSADIARLREVWPTCVSRTAVKGIVRYSMRRLKRLAEAAGLTDDMLMPRPVKEPRFTRAIEKRTRTEALIRAEWTKHSTIAAVAKALMFSESNVNRISKRLGLPLKPRPPREGIKLKRLAPPRQQVSPKPRSPILRIAAPVVIPAARSIILTPDADRARHRDIPRTACQWPLGDPRLPTFGFCGCQAVTGRPYCDEHMLRAYRQPGDPAPEGEARSHRTDSRFGSFGSMAGPQRRYKEA